MTGQSLIRGSFALPAPDDTDDPSAVDLRRLARLRQQAPRGIEALLDPPAGTALLTSRNGDLALWTAHDQWQAPYVPPLQGHLLAITLGPAPGCCSWLPGEGLQRRHLGGGEVLILPAGEAGFVQWPARHQLLLLSLRPRLLYGAQALRRQATGAPVAARSGLVDPVIHGMATTLQAAGLRDASAAARMADHLARALAAHLVAHYAPVAAPPQGGLTQARLHRVLAFLESRLAEPVSLAEAAEVAGCSVHHFAHLFKAAMGVAPMRYLRDTRMQRARELVETTRLSMREIGLHVGLPEPSRFSQMFRTHWKASPSSLRRLR
jgi:AraC family transcriptional regulator